MNADIIFWYTGAVIWEIIAICIAGSVLAALIIGTMLSYHRSRQWGMLWKWAYMTDDERSMFFESARNSGITNEEWNKFVNAIVKHRKKLSELSKGPITNPECSAYYELNDGTKGQIVRTSPGPWSRTEARFEMRTEKDELIEFRADGVAVHNNAIRIVRKTENEKRAS
jgi:uncharacterized membrane protein YraQ (UPF0718 family)